MTELTTLTELNQKWEAIKGEIKNQTTIRIHRALSWLNRADQCDRDDLDISILCRWMAFNALYGQWDLHDKQPLSERESWRVFADRIMDMDHQERLPFVLRRQQARIRNMFANKYLNPRLWRGHVIANHQAKDHYVTKYQQWRQQKEWINIFDELLERIYLIRCQLVHGAATYQSKLNRENVNDCNIMLEELLNTLCGIMFDNGLEEDWGIMCYPPLKN